MTTLMKPMTFGILVSLLTLTSANAAGWASVHKYVKRSGNCAGQEVLASTYSSGKRTASGEQFDARGITAAARTWPLGTSLTVTNPQNGRSIVVRINDRGPWGIAYRMGARLDLARGAAGVDIGDLDHRPKGKSLMRGCQSCGMRIFAVGRFFTAIDRSDSRFGGRQKRRRS